MGDEQTNSGRGVNRLGKTGTRSRGVERAVELARLYPGIDGATMGWVQMGGKLVNKNGMYHVADPEGFANFLFSTKLSARAYDASKRTKNGVPLLVECTQMVSRSVSATGYRVAGGGSFPDPSLKVSDRPIVPQPQPAGCGKPDKKREKNESKPVDFASLASNNIGNLMKDLK